MNPLKLCEILEDKHFLEESPEFSLAPQRIYDPPN